MCGLCNTQTFCFLSFLLQTCFLDSFRCYHVITHCYKNAYVPTLDGAISPFLNGKNWNRVYRNYIIIFFVGAKSKNLYICMNKKRYLVLCCYSKRFENHFFPINPIDFLPVAANPITIADSSWSIKLYSMKWF